MGDVALVQLSKPATLALNVAAWALASSAAGYAAHRMPLARLQDDGWLLRARRFERDGRLYGETLRIKRWKDRLPDAGGWSGGGMAKRHLPGVEAGGLERFAAETRRAERCHWLAMAPAPLFALWNPPLAVVATFAYACAANLPFIAIQRYNRIRVARVLARDLARRSAPPRSSPASGEAAMRARSSRGTTGTTIP